MNHPDIPKLYVQNEYGVEYIDYSKKPTDDLVEAFKDNYNINTDCHNYCVTCQITQVAKYKDSDEWSVKATKSHVYKEESFSELSGTLKRFQKLRLLERKKDKALVQSTINYGLCIRDETHPKVYREDKGEIAKLRCSECESAMTHRVERVEGWILFSTITAFKVKCSFIPKEYKVPEKLKNTLSPEEQEAALSLLDPVKWARDVLGIELREHQKLDAMCTAKHTVRRWGRRSGKSYSECQKVLRYCLTEKIYDGLDANNNPVFRGPIVLVISPFLSQISMLFDQIKDLLSRNKDIKVLRDVKTPFYEIRLDSGAIIKGFTTGTQTGTEGGTIRGAEADLLLLDEADMMNSKDIKEAIEPIQMTSPNVSMMVSSTPKGKREWFYSICMNSPHYKETFFPSTVLDHWELVKDEIVKEGTSDSHFHQEYMAAFISQIEGVYQVDYVAQAEIAYEYKQQHPVFWNGQQLYLNKPQPDWTYSMGIDWNTNAGVEIVVVGLPPDNVEFWAVDASNIPKRDFQQHVAMEKIIELNRFWNPKFIYVDRGYGAVQYEALQIYAEKAKFSNPGSPDAYLRDRLKSYDFGSKITYRNPATKQIEKQFAKPFLVENSVRQFEQGRVKLPYKDYVLHKQLLNYIVKNISPAGVPIYGMNDPKIGDHRLDALNLALIAYVLEMSDFAINAGAVSRIIHVGGSKLGQRVNKVTDANQRHWLEFIQNLPENIGIPGRLNVRHDPGYVERKETERYNSNTPSRVAPIDGSTGSKDDNVLRVGWESDTEWKHSDSRRASTRSGSIRNNKPKRRSI